MDRDSIVTIADQYPWGSWAVWDESFPGSGCVEGRPERLVDFIHERVEMVTPDVVLMGLNRSSDIPAPFSNFHAPTRKHYDYRLEQFIPGWRAEPGPRAVYG